MEKVCAGCRQNITNREFLICSLCKETYDLQCSQVSEKRFYNTMTTEHRESWKCPACVCNRRKGDNTNTPIRPQHLIPPENRNQPPHRRHRDDEDNVTFRKKRIEPNNDTVLSDEELSILGDTLDHESEEPVIVPPPSQTNQINMDQFEKLLDKKLESNKKSLLLELKRTLVNEIKNTITNEINQNISSLFTEQKSLKSEISTIKTHIANLEAENKNLLTQIQQLQNQISPPSENTTMRDYKQDIDYSQNCKKIVLYGLNEYDERENENELHDRVIHVFREILNTNLVGYIEDLTRIGRRGYRRPIVIEFLSKRMTKYLLQHKNYFRNTGLAITEFLDEKPLLVRNKLRQHLQEARRNGHHAIIKNNTLIIDGQECNMQNPRTAEQSFRIPVSENGDHNNSKLQHNGKTNEDTFFR